MRGVPWSVSRNTGLGFVTSHQTTELIMFNTTKWNETINSIGKAAVQYGNKFLSFIFYFFKNGINSSLNSMNAKGGEVLGFFALASYYLILYLILFFICLAFLNLHSPFLRALSPCSMFSFFTCIVQMCMCVFVFSLPPFTFVVVHSSCAWK